MWIPKFVLPGAFWGGGGGSCWPGRYMMAKFVLLVANYDKVTPITTSSLCDLDLPGPVNRLLYYAAETTPRASCAFSVC